jgi:hypothetical protein
MADLIILARKTRLNARSYRQQQVLATRWFIALSANATTLKSQFEGQLLNLVMQTNILWSGREYYSLENCLVNTTGGGTDITSTIIGHYEKKIYKVEYHIKTNRHWETIFFKIDARHSNQTQVIQLKGDGHGNWKRDGEALPQFNGCIDIDIPLTPFTNTLPINRLNLTPGQTQEIQVLYLDLLAQEIKPVRQKYTCISSSEYHYENVPNDFEANIRVDDSGLVVDYPQLFVRSAELETSYR